MKIGLITSIFEGMGLKEVVDFAAESGLECLEVACWPTSGGEKRRYAGVSHIKTENLTAEKAEEIKAYMKVKGVDISALAYYPNMLDPDEEKRRTYVEHLYRLIDASALLDVNMVTTFLKRLKKSGLRFWNMHRQKALELQLKTVRCYLQKMNGRVDRI